MKPLNLNRSLNPNPNRNRRNDPVWVISTVLILLSFVVGFIVGFMVAKDQEEKGWDDD